MAEKLSLPLILPNPPPHKPFFQDHHHHSSALPPPPSTPLFHHLQNGTNFTRIRRRIGKHNDPNKGKPWSHHNRLSPQDGIQLSLETLRYDVLSIIKALGYHNKCDVALSVFQWFRKHSDWEILLKGSVAAVVITMLGKEGRVSSY
ncbi:hypothetical protein Leryth_026483 [Lithospermum erythrorhizon]|nr:hypothetical protein Leryth_026483 [Lithospermum erythrorhizon]